MYDVYVMPQGDWGAFAVGTFSDGFKTREDALEWCCKKMEEYINKGENNAD